MPAFTYPPVSWGWGYGEGADLAAKRAPSPFGKGKTYA